MAQSWYPFYVGDYARKTAHLSMLEHGAYRLLLDHYYATGEPLPDDNAKLFRICRARTPSERQSVLSTVAEFFTKDGMLLRSEKCDRVLDKQLNYSNSQSAKAKLRHSNGNATAMPRARVTKTRTKTKVSKDTNIGGIVLPDWLPSESWEEFKQHRRNKKDPLTPLAESKALNILAGFVLQGYDPIELIDKAIASGWKTFYISNSLSKQHGEKHATHFTNTNTYQKPSWKSEGERLAAKYGAEAERLEREEQAALISTAEPNLCITETIRQDSVRA